MIFKIRKDNVGLTRNDLTEFIFCFSFPFLCSYSDQCHICAIMVLIYVISEMTLLVSLMFAVIFTVLYCSLSPYYDPSEVLDSKTSELQGRTMMAALGLKMGSLLPKQAPSL